MASKVGRIFANEPLRLQRLKRATRAKWGDLKFTYLAKVGGVIKIAGKNLYWVHDPAGADANGATTYGAPYKLRAVAGAAIYERENLKVKVRRENGVLKIYGVDEIEAENAGFDLSESNILNPRVRDSRLIEHLSNAQAYKQPGTTFVQVNGTIYRKAGNVFGYIPQTQNLNIITDNLPASGNQVVVALWWDADNATFTQTVSSEISADTDLSLSANLATGIGLINECAASAPSDAPGITSFILADDGTVTKYHDLRGIFGVNVGAQGFQNPLTTHITLSAGYQQHVHGKLYITTGKLTLTGKLITRD